MGGLVGALLAWLLHALNYPVMLLVHHLHAQHSSESNRWKNACCSLSGLLHCCISLLLLKVVKRTIMVGIHSTAHYQQLLGSCVNNKICPNRKRIHVKLQQDT